MLWSSFCQFWTHLARSNHTELFYKKGALKNFAVFTRKHLCQSLFVNKDLEHLWWLQCSISIPNENVKNLWFSEVFSGMQKWNISFKWVKHINVVFSLWMHLLILNIYFHCAKNDVFFSKRDQISSFLRIWSHLLEKSLTENFICMQCFLLGNANFLPDQSPP